MVIERVAAQQLRRLHHRVVAVRMPRADYQHVVEQARAEVLLLVVVARHRRWRRGAWGRGHVERRRSHPDRTVIYLDLFIFIEFQTTPANDLNAAQ